MSYPLLSERPPLSVWIFSPQRTLYWTHTSNLKDAEWQCVAALCRPLGWHEQMRGVSAGLTGLTKWSGLMCNSQAGRVFLKGARTNVSVNNICLQYNSNLLAVIKGGAQSTLSTFSPNILSYCHVSLCPACPHAQDVRCWHAVCFVTALRVPSRHTTVPLALYKGLIC